MEPIFVGFKRAQSAASSSFVIIIDASIVTMTSEPTQYISLREA
jgi:hypothetical protein